LGFFYINFGLLYSFFGLEFVHLDAFLKFFFLQLKLFSQLFGLSHGHDFEVVLHL